MKCKKCNTEFKPCTGLKSFCSLKCRNSRTWTDLDKKKKSDSAKKSDRVKFANRNRKRNKHRLTKICLVCGKCYEVPLCKKSQKTCSVVCRDIGYSTGVYSESYKNQGGYRKGSGHGKSGWYKGYWCDSSYELAWVIYSLEHDIHFERNLVGYNYTYDGKEYMYYPDFLLIDEDELIEIKGYINEKTVQKHNSVKDKRLRILMKDDLTDIFNYVVDKYGPDYIKLYEDNPHNKRKNKCLVCGAPCKLYYCSRQCTGRGNNKNSKIKRGSGQVG